MVTGEGGTVGDQLRECREAQGFSLDEVAQRTRVPRRHLVLIEDGEYGRLPAATYSAGFVKAYARVLGLDAQALSDQFRRESAATVVRPERPEPYEPADPRRTPPFGVALMALLVALMAGLGFLYWRGSRDQPAAIAARGPGPDAAVAAGSAPVAAALAGPSAPAAAASGPVVIGASQEVWIKVAAGERTLFLGMLKPGNRFEVPADAVDPMLTTGRPGNTLITVGETPIPPVGDPDRVAKDVSLKADALLARVATSPPAAQPAAGAPVPVTGEAGPV